MNLRTTMRTAFMFLLACISIPTLLSAQGIEFYHDLDSALAKAKAENKAVFIDFYTSWCAPCKVMSKDVFPQEKVGNYFNKQFINCKVQCDDKGVGEVLGKKYQVIAYPTLMFVDKNGELIHSASGDTSPEGLIELAKIALNPDGNLLSLIKQWNAGNREDEFLGKYFHSLKDAYMYEKANADFLTYFNELKAQKKADKKTFELAKYIGIAPFSPIFTYIEENPKSYYKNIGKEEVDKYIAKSYLWYLKGLINKETRKEYEIAKAKFKAKKYPYYDEYAMFYTAFEVEDSTGDINVNEYMKRGDAFLQKYGKNNDNYTIALTSLLGNCTGRPDQTVMGIKWMEDLLQRNRDPSYLQIYFYIVVRNYQCDKAQKIGEEMRANAIQKGQSTKSIDGMIATISQYRARLEKSNAAKKTN